MALQITMSNPERVGQIISDFQSDVSGTGEVIESLMDLWMYANRSECFLQLEPACRENMFFVLKKTLQFVAQTDASITTEWIQTKKK